MLMSDSTRDKLNELVTATFQMNSFCDNLAYNFDAYTFVNVSDIFHHHFAHKFPELADQITDLMNKLGARAIRGALHEDVMDYGGNFVGMFADLVSECAAYRDLITKVIDIAEVENDYEVKIHMEEFLMNFLPLYKQAMVWVDYAKRYENDGVNFDIHFDDFTTYLGVVD